MVRWTSFGIGGLVTLHHSVSTVQLGSVLPNTLGSGSRDPNEFSLELGRSDAEFAIRLATAPDIFEVVNSLPRMSCKTCQVESEGD